jgi:hypothetical protein
LAPPAGFSGALQLKVVARDDQGRQAETQVRITSGEAAPAAGPQAGTQGDGTRRC